MTDHEYNPDLGRTMKTPEQIAREHFEDDGSDLSASVIESVVAAINADRDQHDGTYALDIIQRQGGQAVVWVQADAESVLDEMINEGEVEQPNSDEYAEIIDRAMDSYYWSSLSDCRDSDWDAIREAIREARDRES